MLEHVKSVVRTARKGMEKVRFRVAYACVHRVVNIDAQAARAYLLDAAPPPVSSALTQNNVKPGEYDLTIIVPAYNAGRWIAQCLDSILSQKTRYRYVIRVVNDGSADETGAILEKYRGDARIEITHQENKGYSGARNIALKNLRSEYVMFVDSDDYLLEHAIDTLLTRGFREEADIVEGNGFRFDESGRLGKIKQGRHADTPEGLWGGPCLKIIRSGLFERIEFPEGYLYEDTIIRSLIASRANRIVVVPDEVYAYRIHENSITQKHTANPNRMHSYWIMELMHEHMVQLGIKRDYARYCEAMRHIVFTYRRTILLPQEIKENLFAATCGFVETQYPEYMKTKDEYAYLADALAARDYAKYCVCCEANIW